MTVAFFIIIVTLVPFAIGPDEVLLSRIGTSVIWISALLSSLLTLDRLFQRDFEDGSLDLLILMDHVFPVEFVVLAKCLAHWLLTSVPLVMTVPALSLLLYLELDVMLNSMIALLIGTATLTIIGSIGAALTLALRCGNVLTAVLILPFTIPVLVLGVFTASSDNRGSITTPLIALLSLAVIFSVMGPILSAAALKITNE